jgi:hypothetical protein
LETVIVLTPALIATSRSVVTFPRKLTLPPLPPPFVYGLTSFSVIDNIHLS